MEEVSFPTRAKRCGGGIDWAGVRIRRKLICFYNLMNWNDNLRKLGTFLKLWTWVHHLKKIKEPFNQFFKNYLKNWQSCTFGGRFSYSEKYWNVGIARIYGLYLLSMAWNNMIPERFRARFRKSVTKTWAQFMFTHTYIFFLEILLKQTKIRLYLQFYDAILWLIWNQTGFRLFPNKS